MSVTLLCLPIFVLLFRFSCLVGSFHFNFLFFFFVMPVFPILDRDIFFFGHGFPFYLGRFSVFFSFSRAQNHLRRWESGPLDDMVIVEHPRQNGHGGMVTHPHRTRTDAFEWKMERLKHVGSFWEDW